MIQYSSVNELFKLPSIIIMQGNKFCDVQVGENEEIFLLELFLQKYH